MSANDHPSAFDLTPTAGPLPDNSEPRTTEAEPMAIEDIRDALVIRHNGAFLLTDKQGNIPFRNVSGLGLYRDDTRFLSRYEFRFSEAEPTMLLTTAALGFSAEQVLTNPTMTTIDGQQLRRATVEVRRQRVMGDALEERLRVTSFHTSPIELEFQYSFAADFADIFEVRGLRRPVRGQTDPVRQGDRSLRFGYVGLDGVQSRTIIEFSHPPEFPSEHSVVFRLPLNPGEAATLTLTIHMLRQRAEPVPLPADLFANLEDQYRRWRSNEARIFTSSELFNAVLDQSLNDLRTLWNEDGDNAFIAAGTPWFDTLFGRDSAITSLQLLAFDPSLARQTLAILAALQGTEVNQWRDEEPGKILHETRRGEVARTKELPFGLYYGSIDSTPLFLLLAAEYWAWTADSRFLRALMPAILAALEWTRLFGDLDRDGFLEYAQHSERGLLNQGWKDSGDAIVQADGSLAPQPIALVEVQGYLYAAKVGLARVMAALRQRKLARQLQSEAQLLKRQIDRDFWLQEGFYALALDGYKRPVASRTSNPGHLLFAGVPPPRHAARVIDGLLNNDLFSGWGIRTLSTNSPRFNPLGYHIGSVWPHDNSIAAMGFKKYGREAELQELATALFDAARAFDSYRLPELFCGTPRSAHRSPVPYPVACRPQAWAAGTMPFLLQALLGLCPNAPGNELLIVRPQLPYWLEQVQVRNLRLGHGMIDLLYEQRNRRTQVAVLNATGGLRVSVVGRWPL